MAEKVVLVLDLEKGDFDKTFEQLIKDAGEAGDEAGKEASKGFTDKLDQGADSLGQKFKNLASTVADIAKVAIAAGAAVAGVVTAKSIQLASEQEDAVNRLTTALITAGDFSSAALKDFEAFASGLQKISRFGDEAILNQLALAKSFGATNSQAKEIVSAATDLAAAFGTDLESATRNVSKTLGGFAGELGEQIPKLKQLSAAQLQAGAGIKVLAEQYRGFAQREVKSFSGAVTQARNAFGDLLEKFGEQITKSPAIIASITKLNNLFVKLAENFQGINITEDLIFPLIQFGQTITEYVVPAFELLFNISNIVFNSIKTGFTTLGLIANKAIGLFAKVTKNKELEDSIKSDGKLIEETFTNSVENTKKSFDKLFDGSFTENLGQRLTEIKQFFTDVEARALISRNKQKEIIQNNNSEAKESIKTFGDFISETNQKVNSSIFQTLDKTKTVVKATNQTVTAFAKNTRKALEQGVGQAAANGFAAFGAALANGENALEAFGKAFLQQIANLAIQQGTQFILQGTGYLFIPGFQTLGKQLIAAGAGLAAFGGALGATVGGGTSSAGGGGAGGGGASPVESTPFEEDTDTLEPTAAEEGAKVQLIIQGDVLDSQESGTRIAQILSESFGSQGIVLSNGSFV